MGECGVCVGEGWGVGMKGRVADNSRQQWHSLGRGDTAGFRKTGGGGGGREGGRVELLSLPELPTYVCANYFCIYSAAGSGPSLVHSSLARGLARAALFAPILMSLMRLSADAGASLPFLRCCRRGRPGGGRPASVAVLV